MTRFPTPRIPAIVIAAVVGLALPAAASAAPKAAGADTSASEQQSGIVKSQRYYVVDDSMTGSRLARRECKTLDAWLAEGFDPRAKK